MKSQSRTLIEKRKAFAHKLSFPDGSILYSSSWDLHHGITRRGAGFFHWFNGAGKLKGFWSCLGGGCEHANYIFPLGKENSKYFVSSSVNGEFGIDSVVHQLDGGLSQVCEYSYWPEPRRDDADFEKLASDTLNSIAVADSKCSITKPKPGLRIDK